MLYLCALLLNHLRRKLGFCLTTLFDAFYLFSYELRIQKIKLYSIMMFYSKPDIKSLKYDLKELPIPEGSRNLYAQMTDGTHVGIRISGDWLQVRTSPEDGTTNYFDMDNIVLDQLISPYYIDDPCPKAFCKLLGLTIQGKHIESELVFGPNKIDLSGNMTYWKSSHIGKRTGDMAKFVDSIQAVFPEVVIFQTYRTTSNKTEVRRRIVDFVIDSDDSFTLGFGISEKEKKKILENDNLLSIPFSFHISNEDYTNDPSLVMHFEKTQEIHKKGYKYNTIPIKHYRLGTSFKTDDSFSQNVMQKLLALLNQHFSCQIERIYLKTGEVAKRVEQEDHYSPWLSRNLIEWSRRDPCNYVKFCIADESVCGIRSLR